MFCYQKEATEEDRKKTILESYESFKKIDKHLEGKTFLVGEHFTIADAYLYETFLVMKLIHEEICTGYKNVVIFIERFEKQEWF